MDLSSATDVTTARLRVVAPALDPKLAAVAARTARSLSVDAAVVLLVDDTKEAIVAHSDLPNDLAGEREAVWSLGRQVVREQKAVVVPDSRADRRVRPSMAQRAYAAVPILLDGAGVVGALVVVHSSPRAFRDADMAVLDMAAEVVTAQMETERARKGTSVPKSGTRTKELPSAGELFDEKYWIVSSLGQGGQARVFLARDRLTGQRVAIKIMEASPRSEQTLVNEARALARVRHPNLVTLHGWGHTESGQMYVVLDFVEGTHLPSAERLPATEAMATVLKTGRELAGALATMHAVGLIHGDVKPTNILRDRQLDQMVLIDLGIGVFFEKEDAYGAGGTPGYSAPEQLCGGVLSPATDVYALAATLYSQLTGRGPFQHHPEGRVLGAQLGGRLTPLSAVRSDLPDSVTETIAKALSPHRLDRPPGVLEFVHMLERAFAQATGERVSAARAPIARTSGRTFRCWRREVRARLGVVGEEVILGAIPEAARSTVLSVTSNNGWYPTEALVAYANAVSGGNGALVESLGEGVMKRILPEMLSLLNVTRTKPTLVRVIPDLVRELVDWLDIGIHPEDETTLRLEMRMPAELSFAMCPFNRGAVRGFASFLGIDVDVSELRCCHRGDAVCEIVVRTGRASA